MRTTSVVRGVWQDAPALGSGAIPVATYSSYDKTINTGRGLHPVRMVSDVTVSPTHRRRGLLRALMTEDLADAAEQGVPLAVLTASRRLDLRTVRLRAGRLPAGGRWTPARGSRCGPADDGSVELLEPAEAWPAVAAIFARFHERTRGSVERPQFYETILTGKFDFEERCRTRSSGPPCTSTRPAPRTGTSPSAPARARTAAAPSR